MRIKLLRIYMVMVAFIFNSFSGNADVLNDDDEEKLLADNPNIITSFVSNRSLQFWVLSSNGKGIIWCETFVNEDKVRTETICFDDVDPDD